MAFDLLTLGLQLQVETQVLAVFQQQQQLHLQKRYLSAKIRTTAENDWNARTPLLVGS